MREMTRTELGDRIAELAAERDAAIDARLTAERERVEALGDRANETLDRVRDNERERFLLRRTTALLESTGYTTVDRAAAEARRELAVVLGGGS